MKYYSSDYFIKLKDLALQYARSNYDYCYLRAMHERNRCVGTPTIIAGSSHAMNGIVNEKIDGGCINFSVSSQDIYYDFLHIKKALREGKTKIKNCIINIGYYMLYQDLSSSKVMSYLIPRVYEPLFGDAHHYKSERPYDMLQKLTFEREIYSEELIYRLGNEWAAGFFSDEPSYYGSMLTRENNNILGIKKVIWNQLTDEEKKDIAIKRTNDHNRLKKHIQSRTENAEIIYEMAEYLYQKGVIPIFVIFPFTAWYNSYIDKEYKQDIVRVLESLPFPVEFLDMNDYEGIFDDSDFLDTDHLNMQGALKATEFLNEFLMLVNERG